MQIDIVGPPLAQGIPSVPQKDGYETGYEDGKQQQWQPPPHGATASFPTAQYPPAQY